jgi:hypothetical protein
MNEQKQPETTETDEKVCSIEYFCELCGFYPLMPIHGHYECPQCHYKTKCCEGMAL